MKTEPMRADVHMTIKLDNRDLRFLAAKALLKAIPQIFGALIADFRDEQWRGAEVSVNGDPVRLAVRAGALWNGGIGYVVYLPTTVSGGPIIADNRREYAWAVRFGRVRVEARS